MLTYTLRTMSPLQIDGGVEQRFNGEHNSSKNEYIPTGILPDLPLVPI